MLPRSSVTAATVAVLLAGSAHAQKPHTDTATVGQLVQLNSSDPLERAVAFETLNKRPAVWAGKGDLLLRLVRRENELMESTLRASNSMEGVSVKYGEGFGEYTADVWAACMRYCSDPRSELVAMHLRNARSDVEGMRDGAVHDLGIMALPKSGYPATARATIDDALIAATRDRLSSGVRQGALFALQNVVSSDPHLSPDTRSAIHTAFVAGASDSWGDVRMRAVQGLALFADPADRPLLSRIAQSDTGYQVRGEAKQALKKLPPP
jgi:hypothetical protein